MSRPHIYTVHVNPALSHAYEKAEFIEEGFNWKAFVFSWLWTLYHRLWWQAGVVFVLHVVLLKMLDEHDLSHAAFFIIQLGIHLIVGFHGNDWRRTRLKNKGYITADIVSGNSLLSGQQRFFDRYFASNPSAPFVP